VKSIPAKSIAVLFCIAWLTACGSSSSDSDPVDSSEPVASPESSEVTPDLTANPPEGPDDSVDSVSVQSWSIDGLTLNGEGPGLQRFSDTFSTTTAATIQSEASDDVFFGSSITIFASTLNSGDYALVDSMPEFTSAMENSPGSPVAFVAIRAGTIFTTDDANTSVTEWSSVSGILTTVVDAEGVFSFSTPEPLVFVRTLDIGDATPDPRDQVTVSINSVSGQEP